MDDRLARLEAALEALAARVDGLERRQGEGVPAGDARLAEVDAATGRSGVATRGARSDFVALLSLTGRSVIVLGGAYLLRAMTEAGVVAPAPGSALALAYAVGWLMVSGRSARRGRQDDAAFHAATASCIAFPLLWEATVRFRFLAPVPSAAALAGFTGFALFVAGRTSQHILAWLATLGGLATAVGLMWATGAPLPYAAMLLALGVATLWLGYVRDWTVLRWPVAFVVDLVALGLTSRALTAMRPEPPAAVLALLLALQVGYLLSMVVRTLVRGRDVIAFEILQSALALLVGLSGSILIMRETGIGRHWFGASVLALGVAGYAVSFAFVDRQRGRGLTFYYYTSLALVLTLVGTRLVLGADGLAWAGAALGTAAVVLARQYRRLALGLHAVVYLALAGLASGLFTATAQAFLGPGLWWPSPSGWTALAALGIGLATPRQGYEDHGAWWASLQRFAVLVLALAGVAGVDVTALAVGVAALVGRALTAGELGAVRTVVLAASALFLAWAPVRARLPEAGWLVYPILVVAGARLLVVDVGSAGALPLGIALAAYGVALIVAPRHLRVPAGVASDD